MPEQHRNRNFALHFHISLLSCNIHPGLARPSMNDTVVLVELKFLALPDSWAVWGERIRTSHKPGIDPQSARHGSVAELNRVDKHSDG